MKSWGGIPPIADAEEGKRKKTNGQQRTHIAKEGEGEGKQTKWGGKAKKKQNLGGMAGSRKKKFRRHGGQGELGKGRAGAKNF